MEQVINEISHNVVLWTAVLAWFVAQLIKFVMELWHNKNFSWYVLLLSTGGMPSSHSAFVSALMTMVGFKEGFNSSQFAMSAAFSMVIMVDAAGLRRAAGKQAAVLNMLIEKLNNPSISIDKKLRELLGHTPIEVAAGALLGIVMGTVSSKMYGYI